MSSGQNGNGVFGHNAMRCSRISEADLELSQITVVLGAQWGDEGKGKIVDLFATDADVVCRCQGGNNAGHTVVVDEREYALHLLPTGIIHEKCKAVIGNGVVVHLPSLFDELKINGILDQPDWDQRLVISDRAHLVFDLHQQLDGINETKKQESNSAIGTTKKGIGPTYSTKSLRSGLRVCDLLGPFDEFRRRFQALVDAAHQQYPDDFTSDVEAELKKYEDLAQLLKKHDLTRDTVSYLHKKLHERPHLNILVEGANGFMLDIDFGSYPFVTSSNCTIGGVLTGLGVSPRHIGDVIGVTKVYCTRVGAGAFPTEQDNEDGRKLGDIGAEFGVTTKRRRRCGWLDVTLLKYSHMVNGYTALALTKLDIFDTFEKVKIGVSYTLDGKAIEYVPATITDFSRVEVVYETYDGWMQDITKIRQFDKLPVNAQNFVKHVERLIGVPVKWIGVGKSRDAIVSR